MAKNTSTLLESKRKLGNKLHRLSKFNLMINLRVHQTNTRRDSPWFGYHMFVQEFHSSLKTGKLHHGIRNLSHPQWRKSLVKSDLKEDLMFSFKVEGNKNRPIAKEKVSFLFTNGKMFSDR